MGFDDFFEDKRSHHGHYREHGYHDDHDHHRYSHGTYPSGNGYNDHQRWAAVLDKVRSNKKLQLIIAMAGIIAIVVAITLIIVLFPFIMKLVYYISQNGLQGILDGITGFLDKLWKGSGK